MLASPYADAVNLGAAGGTGITLLDGSSRPVERLTPGELVVAPAADGSFVADIVLAVACKGYRPCWRLTTRGGRGLTATLDTWVYVPGDGWATLARVLEECGLFGGGVDLQPVNAEVLEAAGAAEALARYRRHVDAAEEDAVGRSYVFEGAPLAGGCVGGPPVGAGAAVEGLYTGLPPWLEGAVAQADALLEVRYVGREFVWEVETAVRRGYVAGGVAVRVG